MRKPRRDEIDAAWCDLFGKRPGRRLQRPVHRRQSHRAGHREAPGRAAEEGDRTALGQARQRGLLRRDSRSVSCSRLPAPRPSSVLKGPQATSALAPNTRLSIGPGVAMASAKRVRSFRLSVAPAACVLKRATPCSSKPALSAPPDPKRIRSRARNGNSERPLFPKRAERRVSPAERPARRRHLFLAKFFLAIAIGGERWSSGVRGERSIMRPPGERSEPRGLRQQPARNRTDTGALH